MDSFAKTDIGRLRQNNEDSYYCGQNLFIVADGMGGHLAGEVASETSIKIFSDLFLNSLSKKRLSIKKELLSALQRSNSKVYELSRSDLSKQGMGTTFTACYIQNNNAHICHLGDTRFYLKRKDEFRLVTKDHTVVWELYENGVISFDDMFDHPQNNLLLKVLGTSKDIEPDYYVLGLEKGDICLLCSDGLNAMLKDGEISSIIDEGKSLEEIGNKLIDVSNLRGGLDNITLILLRF